MAEGKVLLIDDEEDFTGPLAERMKVRGFAAVTVSSGAKALELVDNEPFDAIILDMIMPGMDGMETLRRLREKNPALQVIMLTGHADLKSGIEAIKLGAADYLEKPADINELMKKIKDAQARKILLVEKRMQDKIEGILRDKSW